MTKRWIVAQIGAREHYGLAVALERRRQLRTLYTDMWFAPSLPVPGWFPAAATSLAARRHPEIPASRVCSFTGGAIRRETVRWLNSSADSLYRWFIETGEWFANRVRQKLERASLDPDVDAFLGYNTGCLEVLRLLRARGVFSVVDQIDPARTEASLVREERERWPGWEPSPPPIPNAYWERLSEEWSLADRVIVNSQWSKVALEEQGVPSDKLVVLPLAYEPHARMGVGEARVRSQRTTLTVLWFGTVTLRKGIPYLLEAARRLLGENVRFVIAGPVLISSKITATAPANVSFIGRVARSAMPQVFGDADLFVLPTISDGFAITQLEAMAHGLPVIATPNCGDVVNDGVNGYIVPPRNADQLASVIGRLVGDRDLLRRMSGEARRRSNDFSIARLGASLEALGTHRSEPKPVATLVGRAES